MYLYCTLCSISSFDLGSSMLAVFKYDNDPNINKNVIYPASEFFNQ